MFRAALSPLLLLLIGCSREVVYPPGEAADTAPLAQKRVFISRDVELDAMASDLGSEVRNFDVPIPFRYVSFVNLHNEMVNSDDSSSTEEDLALYRLGFFKNLLSLTRADTLELPPGVPVEVDGEVYDDLIYRVNLDVYGMRSDRVVDAWEEIVKAYPYGVYEGGEDVDFLRQQTGSRLPYLNADAFVALSAEHPIYFDVLQIPETVTEFLTQFSASLPEQFDDPNLVLGDVYCAGFEDSGVSFNDRVICRLSANQEYCYVSFDFANNNVFELTDIFTNPLDFVADGGEMICRLQNGMQAYLVVDGEGVRLNRGPVQVVDDPAQRPDENGDTVATKISCDRCHEQGLLVRADQINDWVSDPANQNLFDDETIERAGEIYNPAFQEKILEDIALYEEALAIIGVDPADAEPVSSLYDWHHSDLDKYTAAAALGTEVETLEVVAEVNDEIRRALSNLREEGEISRDTFDEIAPILSCLLNPDTCSYGDPDSPDYDREKYACGVSYVPCLEGQHCWSTGVCSSEPEPWSDPGDSGDPGDKGAEEKDKWSDKGDGKDDKKSGEKGDTGKGW